MVGEIKAIETNYMGCRFRSRLEARWAVFFDALGWSWEYEKEGYVLGCYEGENPRPWLPDFEIITPSGQHFYVEVKGDPDSFADGEWLARFDFDGGPPGFQDCGWSDKYDKTSKPLLLLGDIPRFNGDNVTFYAPVIVHYKGVRGHLGKLTASGVYTEPDFYWDYIGGGGYGVKDFQILSYYQQTPDPAVNRALRAASGARFEHGEKPFGVASYGG